MWFLHRLHPESDAYNGSTALHLRGPLDVKALERSLAAIVARHEVLRSTFEDRAGTLWQVPSDYATFRVRLIDVGDVAGDAPSGCRPHLSGGGSASSVRLEPRPAACGRSSCVSRMTTICCCSPRITSRPTDGRSNRSCGSCPQATPRSAPAARRISGPADSVRRFRRMGARALARRGVRAGRRVPGGGRWPAWPHCHWRPIIRRPSVASLVGAPARRTLSRELSSAVRDGGAGHERDAVHGHAGGVQGVAASADRATRRGCRPSDRQPRPARDRES